MSFVRGMDQPKSHLPTSAASGPLTPEWGIYLFSYKDGGALNSAVRRIGSMLELYPGGHARAYVVKDGVDVEQLQALCLNCGVELVWQDVPKGKSLSVFQALS